MFVNIDQTITNATKQISFTQERKQFIINEVVSDKVKERYTIWIIAFHS